MPAELPPGKQAQIARMHAQGRTRTEIARELGIDRHTVGVYCARIANAAALAGTPAAALDANDVAVVRMLAGDNLLADLAALTVGLAQNHGFVPCRLCQTNNVVLVSQESAQCPRCGVRRPRKLVAEDLRRHRSSGDWAQAAGRVETAAQRGHHAATPVGQAAQPVNTDGET